MRKYNQSFPRWRQLLASSLDKSRSKPRAKYFQVANVDLNGLPRNRTLVFRGFDDGNNNILAITDRRSHKYSQWRRHGFSEICWYFDGSREQYRISCRIHLIDCAAEDQTIRVLLWSSLSSNARSQFFWPHPAEPYNENSLSLYNTDTEDLSGDPPDSFVGLVFIPNQVDYLNLKTHPQSREISTLVHANSAQKQTGENVTYKAIEPTSKNDSENDKNAADTTIKLDKNLNDETHINAMHWDLCTVNP